MLPSSLVGILFAVLAVVIAIVLEGASFWSFFQISSLLLILGGTLGSTWASFSTFQIYKAWGSLKDCFFPSRKPDLLPLFLGYWEISRRDGLLALEEKIQKNTHPFLQKGIKLIVDGSDPRTVEELLLESSDEELDQDLHSAKVWETAGGYSPTIGIIGTVLGLVHVLENLGAGTDALGRGIATAFIATFYGIAFANLVFLPLAARIRDHAREKDRYRNAMIRGILALHSGENKRILQERIEPFLDKN